MPPPGHGRISAADFTGVDEGNNMESIDEILKTDEPKVEEPAGIVDPPSTIVDPPSDRLRDEHGRFVKKETGVTEQPQAAPEVPAPPAGPVDQLPKEDFTALKDERRKRQELERRLQAMEQQLSAPPKPQQPPADFWDDPQAFMDSRLNQLGETLLQQWERRQTAQRLEISEQSAKAKYTDYDEAFSAFEQAVQANPRLAHEMAQAADPGEFAYRKGKTALEIQKVGSIDELRAQIRAELEQEARKVIQPQFPSTTAADGSVGGRAGPEWSGPQPLSQIIR
jgi:hypothetical protein